MRLLDRYVLITFLKNYLIALMVLLGLYVVLDMVFAFDEFAEIKDKAGLEGSAGQFAVVKHIAGYYGYQSFRIFAYLSGIIPVVAAAFSIIRLARFNEMTATLAAGMPLLRLAAPIVLCGVVLNLVLLPIDQELIIPRIIPQLERKHDQLDAADNTFPIRSLRDTDGRLLVAARYHPPAEPKAAWMEYVSIIEYDAQHRPVSHTSADRATWDAANERWTLHNGQVVRGLLPDERRAPPEPVEAYKSNINPEEVALYRSGDYVELLSTQRIDQLLARRQAGDQQYAYGVTDLLRVKHTRFTAPLLNLILLLLGMGCLLTRDPSTLKVASLRCAVVVALCMTAIFLSQQLAGTPPAGGEWANRWPAIMAWLPILLFGPVAVFLLDRVKT